MHITKRKYCNSILCNKGVETCLEGNALLCELEVWRADLICFLYFIEVLKTALYTKLATCGVLAVDWKLTLKFTLEPWRVIYPATVFKYGFVSFIFSHFYWVLLSLLYLVLSLLLCLELCTFIFSLLSLRFSARLFPSFSSFNLFSFFVAFQYMLYFVIMFVSFFRFSIHLFFSFFVFFFVPCLW